MLNEKQQKSVEATEGRVRVVAGAGSGKTRVLAHRFAYLVNDIGIAPGNILCLTFTNKAAQEMKQRIARLVDGGSINDFVCTIHSFCVKFLRREIYRIGYPKNFMVIDESDCKELARQAMAEYGIDRKKNTAERFLKNVAGVKGADPAAYISGIILPTKENRQGAAPIMDGAVERYIRLQLKQYALDFDDLLYFTLYILDHFKEARDYWTDLLNYVMVDEVQDCSGDDWKLLHAITSKHHNLFVVGDPDQAIYQWRGGDPKIFVDFRPDTDIILNENYRSTPDILNVANEIIANNRNRVPKDLFTRRMNEHVAVYRHHKDMNEEAQTIAETIEREHADGAKFSDFAVLYRSSFLSRPLEQALLKLKIPYTIWGGVRFFERKEIKDIISDLRLVASDSDDMAFARVVNLPSRKFGDATMKRLRAIAEEEGVPLMVAFRNHLGEQGFNRKEYWEFDRLIENARLEAENLEVSELTDYLLNASGLAGMYRMDEEEERLENVAELINSMKEFERQGLDSVDRTLAAYLQEIALYTNTDHERDKDCVRIMTIHQSKGLEFPTVFVMGLTEGIFPNHRSIRERRKDGEEEERRLMYVAVTRGENMLYLSESEGYLNENGALKYPSRFLTEIPDGMLMVEGDPDPALFEGTRNLVRTLQDDLHLTDEDVWAPGTRVSHKVFGEGIIVRYESASRSYRVSFDGKERMLIGRVLKPVGEN